MIIHRRLVISYVLAASFIAFMPLSVFGQANASLDLVWSGEATAQPFHQAKTPMGPSGQIRVGAIAHFTNTNGERIPEERIRYQWQRNGRNLSNESGRGKSSLITGATPLDDTFTISVEASPVRSNEEISKSITFTPVPAGVAFFEDHPLYGTLYNDSLDPSHRLTKDEITVRAVPYHMSMLAPADPAANFEWEINGQPPQGVQGAPAITLRPEGTEQGSSVVTVRVVHENLLYEPTGRVTFRFNQN